MLHTVCHNARVWTLACAALGTITVGSWSRGAQAPPAPPEDDAEVQTAEPDGALYEDEGFAQCATSCCEASECDGCGDGCGRVRRWFAAGDAIWLQRDTPTNFELARDVEAAGNQVGGRFFDLDRAAGFDQQAGFRALLGYRIGCRGAAEFSYFGLNYWEGSAALRDPSGGAVAVQSPYLGSSIPTADNGFSAITAHYNSELHNAEANLRWYLCESPCGTLSVLTGVRYLSWREQLTLTGKDDFDPNRIETTRIRTFNNLIGWQCGGEFTHGLMQGLLHLGGAAKAGIYGNPALQHTTNVYTGPNAGLAVEGRNLEASSSGILEASLHATLWVTGNLKVRSGYQVMYVTGLALAPDNLRLNETTIRDIDIPNIPAPPGTAQRINNDSDLFLHGPFAGLEYRF